jgi:hypothetical protein
MPAQQQRHRIHRFHRLRELQTRRKSILLLMVILANQLPLAPVLFPERWWKLANSNFGIGRGRSRYRIRYPNRIPVDFVTKLHPTNFKKSFHLSKEEFFELFHDVVEFHGEDSLRVPKTMLGLVNQFAVVWIWFIHYLNYSTIGSLFGISDTLISTIINCWLPKLAVYFASYIPERQISSSTSILDPNIKYIVDATIKPTVRPQINQSKYYSGHYKCHGILTHVIVDYDGWILSFHTNIPGSVHDAKVAHTQPFHHIIKEDKFALGDPGYQGVNWVVAGYKASDLPDTDAAVYFDAVSREEQRMIETVNCFIKKNVLTKNKKFHHKHELLIFCIAITCGWYNYRKYKSLPIEVDLE